MSIQKASKNEVRKEIADLINRIKEQSDRIGMQREIPQSELDLILHRIEELHRKTVVWSYLNELPAEPESSQFSVLSSETKAAPVEVPKPIEPPPAPEPPKVVVAEKVVVPPPGENREPTTENITVKPVASTSGLKDIRSFIGFNEKLMYIRQVFKGDNEAYNAALDQINAMKSWTEAEAFLGVLGREYNWGKDNEPVAIFTHTVKQRFI